MYRACEYVFLTPTTLGRRRYQALCSEFDLEPTSRGYGALLCRDDEGIEVTKLTADPDYLSMVVETICHLHGIHASNQPTPCPTTTRVSPEKFEFTRPGWPTHVCRG